MGVYLFIMIINPIVSHIFIFVLHIFVPPYETQSLSSPVSVANGKQTQLD